MPQVIPSKIAGIFKYPEAKPIMKNLPAGAELLAEREPTNAYDHNAIALYVEYMTAQDSGPNTPSVGVKQKVKCGYLPKELAAQLKTTPIIKVEKGFAFDTITVTI